jgi:hypothetical protein
MMKSPKKNAWTEFLMRNECQNCLWDDDSAAAGLEMNGLWQGCYLRRISINKKQDCYKREYKRLFPEAEI